ncbi:MAG: hypothetical protein OEV91_11360 [Desulfobulbaceae bacterium]|nr:hypothetical protein [Desulfobulbaceae bacterium]
MNYSLIAFNGGAVKEKGSASGRGSGGRRPLHGRQLMLDNRQEAALYINNMKLRICPFCREKIQASATVCRFCQRDLPTLYDRRRRYSLGWLPVVAVAAIIVTGSAFLASGFLKERRHWLNR